MAKLTPAQDKAIQAFGADGDFPKGTREATVKAIESAGLIMSWNGDGSWDLTPDGRAYLGLEPIAETSTPVADWEIELTASLIESNLIDNRWSNPKYLGDNVKVWQNLTLAEIRADIRTAVPIGRAGKRFAAKHNH